MDVLFDDLARTVASPIPRRRVVKLVAGMLMQGALGGLWPRRAYGQFCPTGKQMCTLWPDCVPRCTPTSCCDPGETCCAYEGASWCCPPRTTCMPNDARKCSCPPGLLTCGARNCCPPGYTCSDRGTCEWRCPADKQYCGEQLGRLVCCSPGEACIVLAGGLVNCVVCAPEAERCGTTCCVESGTFCCGTTAAKRAIVVGQSVPQKRTSNSALSIPWSSVATLRQRV
jgi:hypothetical protein